MGVLTLVAKGADQLGKLVLGFALDANGLVGLLNGIHHFAFADFAHLPFHHDNAVHGACHHDVHVGGFQFRTQWVDDKFSVDACHAHL